MNSPSSGKSLSNDWKELYLAALFENDKNKLAQSIAAAHAAIAARRHEILISGNDTMERRVLDNATLSLQALAQCFSMGQFAGNKEFGLRNLG